MADLNDKDAVFVQEYLIDLDPKRAALAAGFSATMAASKAYQWVSNGKIKPRVYAAIRAAMDKRAARTEITQDRVLKELAKLGFADLGNVIKWGTREVSIGYDDEGRKLSPADFGDAVVVHKEMAAFVDAIDSDDLPEDVRAGISEVALTKDGLRIKMHDKKGALETIGRHLGMFKERIEHSGEITFAEGGVSGLLSAVKNAKAAVVDNGPD